MTTGNESSDPFAGDDPLDGVTPQPAAEAPAEVATPLAGGVDDFDALGFDVGFGDTMIGDNDDTPPGGIYVGEEVSVLDAHTIGRALAEADGRLVEDHEPPDVTQLQHGLVGIDIGAAVAVVAIFDGDGHHEIVPNQDDDLQTPVQIFFDDDGEQLVGKEARVMAPSAPGRAVMDLKDALTNPDFQMEPGVEHGSLSAKDVISVLIARLLDDAKEHVGERPTHVALAAPVWYGEGTREVLGQAVAEAGAELVGIADEALAATVPYSLRLPDLNERRALVFDLGHAALSVAVVRCGAGDIEILAQDANKEFGSHAWDQVLADEAGRKFDEAHGHNPLTDDDPGSEMDLRLRAEDAKKTLSQRAQCTLVASSKGNTLKIGFTRRGFEEATKPLREGASALMTKVREAAGINDWKGLDAVIVTGGGSRIPSIRRMLSKETGHEPARGISPEDGVAVGSLYWGIGERHRQSAN